MYLLNVFNPPGMIIKLDTHYHIVYDVLARTSSVPHMVYSMMSITKSQPIVYGRAFMQNLEEFWSLRVSYPSRDILLWDDIFTGAF